MTLDDLYDKIVAWRLPSEGFSRLKHRVSDDAEEWVGTEAVSVGPYGQWPPAEQHYPKVVVKQATGTPVVQIEGYRTTKCGFKDKSIIHYDTNRRTLLAEDESDDMEYGYGPVRQRLRYELPVETWQSLVARMREQLQRKTTAQQDASTDADKRPR